MLGKYLKIKTSKMKDILPDTPIEKYSVGNRVVYVKRDDLCCPPSNAKARGLSIAVRNIKSRGIGKVGIINTRVSRDGWVLAWLSTVHDFKAYIYYPNMKDESKVEWRFLEMAERCGAELVPLKPGRDWWLYVQARRHARENNIYLLPDKLRLPESVDAVAMQVLKAPEEVLKGTIVACVSSGTILAGILKGLELKGALPHKVVGVMISNEATPESRLRYLKKMLGPLPILNRLEIVPSKWSYFDKVEVDAPFPTDRYYDSKAWLWLFSNIAGLKAPVLFWNVGGCP